MTTPAVAAPTVRARERQFQVVPVPAVFTRGRWECSDFRDTPENQILEFPSVDKHCIQALNSAVAALPLASNCGDAPSTSHQMTNHSQISTASSSVPHIESLSLSPTQSQATTVESNDVYYSNNTLNSHGNFNSDSSISTTSIPGTILLNGGSSSQPSGTNPVAIDNKIEQAMDLVKTHLTFAVREEIEILRSSISDLESKVNILENENRVLRQFAPPEVVQNLSMLVQNAQQQHKT